MRGAKIPEKEGSNSSLFSEWEHPAANSPTKAVATRACEQDVRIQPPGVRDPLFGKGIDSRLFIIKFVVSHGNLRTPTVQTSRSSN